VCVCTGQGDGQFLLPAVSPLEPRHRSPKRRPRPCCELPPVQPSLCEGGLGGSFPPAFCFSCCCQQKALSYFLALGVEEAREKYLARIEQLSALAPYFQPSRSLSRFPSLSICELPVFLRETMDPFLALEGACTNRLGLLAPGVSGELPLSAPQFSE